jgi:hypothetical protein
MEGAAPVTNTGSFPTTSEPTILPKKKKDTEYFAGCRVFDVNADEYTKLMHGSKKWDRWNKYFDTSNAESNVHSVKKYLYKNPNKTVVLRRASTQDMVYFKPKGKMSP